MIYKVAHWLGRGLGGLNDPYDMLEHMPVLHDPDVLSDMYEKANHKQRGQIMYHISYYDVQDVGRYKNLANKIRDDYE